MKIGELYNSIIRYFEAFNIENAKYDARYIIEDVLSMTYSQFVANKNTQISRSDETEVLALAQQRAQGIPIQYILGKVKFLDVELSIGPGVLIPRPETEQLVSFVIKKIKKKSSAPIVFDVCSGSGCVGLAIKKKIPDAQVYLIEKSDDAIRYIEINKVKNGFGNSVVVVRYDIMQGIPEFLPKPDFIVSNPPYIPSAELKTLQREVRIEPDMALDGGEDGLDFYRCFAEKWIPNMKNGSSIFVECGENQASVIADLFQNSASIINDMYGVPRFVEATINRRIYDI